MSFPLFVTYLGCSVLGIELYLTIVPLKVTMSRIDADLDPAYHFDHLMVPPPTFHFDRGPDPASQIDADPNSDPQNC